MKESDESMKVSLEIDGRIAFAVLPESGKEPKVELAVIALSPSSIDNWDDQLIEDLTDSFQDWLNRTLENTRVPRSEVERYVRARKG